MSYRLLSFGWDGDMTGAVTFGRYVIETSILCIALLASEF